MKQLLLLMVMTIAGGIAAPYQPFWGLLFYYTLSVLRPQYLWAWALPVEWRWSLFAAAIVLVSVAVNARLLLVRRLTPITMVILAYAVALLFSCLAADDPHLAQAWGEEHAKIIIIAVIAGIFIDQLWHVRLMSLMVMVMLGYIAWEINFMYLFQNYRLDVYHYGYGGLDNNGAGLMLAMGIPVAYVFGVSASKNWQRAVAWGIALLMLHAMLLTYSRGAMLAAIVGSVWLLFQHRARLQAITIAIVACVAISFLAGNEVRQRFSTTSEYREDASAISRMDSWSAAWAMAWDRPFTGQGIRNSNLYSQNYGADQHGRTIHSVYLQIAADCGIPAMLLYGALLVLGLASLGQAKRACRAYLDTDDSSRAPPAIFCTVQQSEALAIGLQTSLIIFCFGAAFLSVEVFELPWLLVVLGGALPRAIEDALAAEQDSDKTRKTVTRRTSSPLSLAGAQPVPVGNKGWVHP